LQGRVILVLRRTGELEVVLGPRMVEPGGEEGPVPPAGAVAGTRVVLKLQKILEVALVVPAVHTDGQVGSVAHTFVLGK
jgi:hypothetical protein